MSSLWTPGGERPVPPASSGPASPGPQSGRERAPGGPREPTSDDMEEQLDELHQQLAEAPASVVVANHCFGLFELAALHLSQKPPKLEDAQLAIDALGHVVEGLQGRLGDQERALRDGLAQLRLAYVQIRSAMGSAAQGGNGDEAATGPGE